MKCMHKWEVKIWGATVTPTLFDITVIVDIRLTGEPFEPSKITKTKPVFIFLQNFLQQIHQWASCFDRVCGRTWTHNFLDLLSLSLCLLLSLYPSDQKICTNGHPTSLGDKYFPQQADLVWPKWILGVSISWSQGTKKCWKFPGRWPHLDPAVLA